MELVATQRADWTLQRRPVALMSYIPAGHDINDFLRDVRGEVADPFQVFCYQNQVKSR
jgi:hypothetical protein